ADGSLVGRLEPALGLGQAVAALDSTGLGGADELDAARLAGGQVADLEIDLVAVSVLQAVAQLRMDLDLLGRAVARVGDGEDEGSGIADEGALGGGRLEDELGLADLDAHDGGTGEGDPRLRGEVALGLADEAHLQALLLLGLEDTDLPDQDIALDEGL